MLNLHVYSFRDNTVIHYRSYQLAFELDAYIYENIYIVKDFCALK